MFGMSKTDAVIAGFIWLTLAAATAFWSVFDQANERKDTVNVMRADWESWLLHARPEVR